MLIDDVTEDTPLIVGSELKAPFPWFGGKARAAPLIWERLGDVRNYVEPFFGSGAVLLRRPLPFDGTETVNDADGYLANFWRAVQRDPETVADFADQPVNENDLHAKHAWLLNFRDNLPSLLEGDPDYFDAKVAGWWVWGLACWIGSGFCSGKGPWKVVETDDGFRQLVHLGNAGQGVNRQLVHLGDAGQGVNRKRVHLGNAGRGVNRKRDDHRASLFAYMNALADRLRHVRVCCGDWKRVMGPTPMHERAESFHPIGVMLDPPYATEANRDNDLYRIDSGTLAHEVREWALAHGDDPRYRIALCGYEGEHAMPKSWACVAGKTGRGHGYGGQDRNGYGNKDRERIWFSPHCINPEVNKHPLFANLFDSFGVEV